MRTHCFEMTVRALSSITHNGGESFGINAKFRREKMVQPDGKVEDVPIVSGNGMRGLLRDRGMLHMCRALGYGLAESGAAPVGLTLQAFHFLFGGGSLTGDGGKAINEEEARRLREAIPLASVFGGAIGNRIMNGRVNIGKLIPVCLETRHILPEAFQERAKNSMWDLLQEEMYTRKDDEKNENLRGVIDERARLLIEQNRAVKAKKTTTEPQADTGAHQQMMYYVETLCAGTEFFWEVHLMDVSDMEYDAFMTAMVELIKHPYIGGKSAVGLGKIQIQAERMIETTTSTAITNELGLLVGQGYAAHLQARADEIRGILARMGAA